MQVFIASCPVYYVDSGDVLALIAGFAIVVAVAIIANPPNGLQISQGGLVKPAETGVQTAISGTITPTLLNQITTTTPVLPKPDALPYRISFTEKPFTYPVYKLPEHLITTGASEIPQQTEGWVPFAFIENTRGGLTQIFSVPYPIWVINTTVVAENQPQYANFRMALCYADTGGIIKSEEIVNRGTSYRIIRTANTSLYMIISVKNIDYYHISLETPREYYNAFSP
ncbi:MAG: hypothetical protein M0Q91_11040 [Methanoregula sp.]|jgi:hypothetical protein|nr:hypothetical protein [Methanoregula sp.]